MRLPAPLAAAATSLVFAVSGVALLPAAASSAPPTPTAASAPAAAPADGGSLSPEVERIANGLAKGKKVRVIATFEAAGGTGKRPDVASIKSARSRVLAGLPKSGYDVVSGFDRIPAVSLEVDVEALAALDADPDVLSVQEDHVVTTTMTEANALTGVNDVHAQGLTGDGVTAAIIDTGVDSDGGTVHPGLADDLAGQACFRTENDCIGGPTSAEDQDGHGTHVAGIVTGPEGAAPDARFYALKVFTTGDTSDTNILNALNHVIGLNNATPGTVDLVNMSLGGDNYATRAACNAASTAYQAAFATLNSQSVTVFVATGNDASTTSVGSPGCVDGAVGVGSTGDATFTAGFSNCTDNAQADKVSCFSNATNLQGTDELVDLLAPGCQITSTGLDGSTDFTICGTSMATPYALGVGALVQEYAIGHGGQLSPAALEDKLETTGKPLTDYRIAGSVSFPRVDAGAAIGSMVLPTPTALQLTGSTTSTASFSWGGSAGADHYQLRRTNTTTGAVNVLPTVGTGTTYTDSAVPCGPLTYTVQAVNAEGYASQQSNSVAVNVRPCPAAPTGVTIVKNSATEHTVSWTPGNVSDPSVVVQRRVSGGSFADLTTIPNPAVTSFTDTVASPCGRVEYRLFTLAANGDRSAASTVVGRSICAPANDDRAAAEVVALTLDATVSDTEPNARYASQETADPNFSCKFGGAGKGFDGVWYTVTPAVNNTLTISTSGSTVIDPSAGVVDTLLAVYNANTLAELACNDDINVGGNDYASAVSLAVTAGTTYLVHAAQWTDVPDSADGFLKTSFTAVGPPVVPPNNDYANAAVINTNPYTKTVAHAQLATVEGTDPAHPCRFSAAGVGTHTLWWKFTPAQTGVLDLDTLASSGSFTDTILSVYTGAPGAFVNIACNDDVGSGQLRSKLTNVAVTAGTTYSILVSRYSTSTTTTAGTVALAAKFTGPAGVTVVPTAVAVEEGRPGAPYTVVLDREPTGSVTVAATGDADCAVSPSSRTFTPANWASPQAFLVTAVDDGLTEPTEGCTVTHAATSSDPSFNGLAVQSVTGTVTDKLTTSVTLTQPADGQFFVKDSVVTADFACSDNRGGAGIVSCVGTAPDGSPIDTSTLGDHDFTVTLTDIHGSTKTETNTYTVTDPPGLALSETTVAVEEGRPGDTYTIELTTQPTANVTVTPAGDADCSVSSALTFTAGDWDTPQTVTVTAVDDGTAEASESCTVTHDVTSADLRFDGVPNPSVTGTVTDKLVTSISLTSPAEGASFVQGAVIGADFACSDNRAGAGITSCVGTVADGSPIDTSSVGSHTFTVTLTDVHGATSTETNTYTVTAAPTPTTTGKPDARITSPAPAIGDNVYGGKKQKKKQKVAVTKKATYTVSLQNDGTGADRLKLLGGKTANGFKVKYVGPDGKNITKAVTGGTFLTPVLAKNATYDIKVIVKVTKKAVKKLKVSVKATSVATPTASDMVFMLTKRL